MLDECLMALAESLRLAVWVNSLQLGMSSSFKGEACHFCSTSGAEWNCNQMGRYNNIDSTNSMNLASGAHCRAK